MSEQAGRAALQNFYEEFMAPVDEPAGSSSKAVGKDVINTLYGGPVERARATVVDTVQESGVLPYAAVGIVSASSLLGPVVAAAQSLSHGIGGSARTGQHAGHGHQAHRKRPEDIGFTLGPGGTIYEIAEKYDARMGVSLTTAEGEIEAESGILPAQVNDLQIGTKGEVPVDPDIAVVPAGEGRWQVAEEHGISPERLNELNLSSDPDFEPVGAHLRLKAEPEHETVKPKAEAEHHHTVPEHHAETKPAPKPKPKHEAAPKPAPKAATATPVSKPKAPIVSSTKAAAPVAPSKPVPAPKPVKPALPSRPPAVHTRIHAKITPTLSPALSSALKKDLGQAFDFMGLKAPFGEGSYSSKRPAGNHHAHGKSRSTKGGECSSTGHMFGKTPEQIAMNYFVICKGLTPDQAAGPVGNLEEESGLNPTRIQDGYSRLKFSKDPSLAGAGGWGLEQLTPAKRVLSEGTKYGEKGNFDTLQYQLVLAGDEISGVSPVGLRYIVKDLRKAKTPNQAALTFEAEFEQGKIAYSGGGQLAARQKLARQAAKDYYATHHKHKVNHARSHHAGRSAVGSSTEIYYNALRFNTDSYSETMIAGHEGWMQWKKNFPTMGPKALIDCSGLVDMDVASITGGKVDKRNNTLTLLQDTKDWKRIPESESGMGDLIEPVIDGVVGEHVEIEKGLEDHGQLIDTFGAHGTRINNVAVPQSEQVGPAQYTYNHRDIFLRYVGLDAPLVKGEHHHSAGHKHAGLTRRQALSKAWKGPLGLLDLGK